MTAQLQTRVTRSQKRESLVRCGEVMTRVIERSKNLESKITDTRVSLNGYGYLKISSLPHLPDKSTSPDNFGHKRKRVSVQSNG